MDGAIYTTIGVMWRPRLSILSAGALRIIPHCVPRVTGPNPPIIKSLRGTNISLTLSLNLCLLELLNLWVYSYFRRLKSNWNMDAKKIWKKIQSKEMQLVYAFGYLTH